LYHAWHQPSDAKIEQLFPWLYINKSSNAIITLLGTQPCAPSDVMIAFELLFMYNQGSRAAYRCYIEIHGLETKFFTTIHEVRAFSTAGYRNVL
jgi:hypothetical protein